MGSIIAAKLLPNGALPIVVIMFLAKEIPIGSNRTACVHTAINCVKLDTIFYLDNSDAHSHGDDTRLAEEALLAAAKKRGGRVLYFTDFAPTNFSGN